MAGHKLSTDELGQRTINGFMNRVGAAKSAGNVDTESVSNVE